MDGAATQSNAPGNGGERAEERRITLMENTWDGPPRRVEYVTYMRPARQGAPRTDPHPGHVHATANSLPTARSSHAHTHPIQVSGRVREREESGVTTDHYVRRAGVTTVPQQDRMATTWDAVATSDAQFETLAAGAQQLNRASADSVRQAEITCEAIRLEHRKPQGKRAQDFASDAERADSQLDSEIACLVPLLPYQVIVAMIGGERGWRQVPTREARDALLTRMLKQRAGSEGDRLASVRGMLRDIRMYAVAVLGVPREKADEASFPMSGAMSHEIIAKAQKEAVERGKGTKGGSTVGHHMRETIIFAAEKLLWPIEAPRVMLESAAPKAHVAARTRAGTLPIAAKCQLEIIARGTEGMVTLTDPTDPTDTVTMNILDLNEIPEPAREAVVLHARSLLAGGIDHSIRIGEGVRIDLWPDEHEPLEVMRGHAYMGKDGAPVDIYAPASGFMGEYAWYPEHLVQCHETGITFPAWEKPHGSKGAITRNGGVKQAVARKEDIRRAFKDLLKMRPLSYTDAEIEEMNLQGHSGHASIPDWARALGENIVVPCDPPLAPELAKGFSEPELDLLGHWLRTAETKDESRAAEAAASSAPGMARRAAAIVLVKAKARSAHKMRNYYGTGGALANRFSERIRQLAARQRLTKVIQATLRRHARSGRSWHQMPRGQLDILYLLGGSTKHLLGSE